MPRHLGARLLVAPSRDHIERAYNHAKYGEFSAAPMLEITVPTARATRASRRPAARALGRRAVRALRARGRLGVGSASVSPSASSRRCDAYAPGLRCSVRRAELLTPPDIEREFRITGGHWHHAELALDQFFMLRPVPGAAQYRAPVAGCILCGAGCHPGGGVMGLAGPQRGARRSVREAA